MTRTHAAANSAAVHHVRMESVTCCAALPQVQGACVAVGEDGVAGGAPGTAEVAEAAGPRVTHALLTHPQACRI